jgi:hypothetical protein
MFLGAVVMRHPFVTAVAATLAALGISTVSRADATITASTHTLAANSDSQIVTLNISGSDPVAGEDLRIQINDGTTGPTITAVDVLTGTIMAGGSTGASQGLFTTGTFAKRLATFSATTASGSVLDNGLLATLTISTAGISGGTFTINLFGTHDGDTDLIVQAPSPGVITPTFPSSSFVVAVPEPTSLAVLALGGLLLVRRSRAR